MNQPSERGKGTRPVPTGLCRFKDMTATAEEKESAEYRRDFDNTLCDQLSECLKASVLENA
jgi:hypothetical protein